MLAMKLYLQGAQAVNNISDFREVEELAYEFMSQSMLIYQEEISEPKSCGSDAHMPKEKPAAPDSLVARMRVS